MKSKLSTLLILALSLILLGQLALAMPPHPDRLRELEALKAFGQAVPDYAALRQSWLEKGVDQPSNFNLAGVMAQTDTLNILALLVQFPDKAAISPAEEFDTLIFSNQPGTVRHYYLETSYGALNLTTVTLPSSVGWQTAANNATYYTSGGNYGLGTYPHNAQKLVEEAVDLSDPVINYADFDNDNDGYVDVLLVVHAGKGAESTMDPNDLWSHKWGITPRLRDGKLLFEYTLMPEYFSAAGDMTCGVFVHELGHIFGLPDLYDTDYSSRGVGRWSVMSTGSWNGVNGSSPAHFDAWSKIKLGFATAMNVVGSTVGASIPDVENSPTIYRLWTNGTVGDEYFLVENRQQTGYDTYLPSEGVLIWHIDEAVSTDNDNEWYPGHTSSGHFLVALEQADGFYQLEQKLSYGDAGDPFPGAAVARSFTPLTTPSSNDYSDANTLVAVTNISNSQDVMTADFTVSFASDADDEHDLLPKAFALDQNYPNPFNLGTRIRFTLPHSSHVELSVFNLLGQKVKTLVDDYLEAGIHSTEWDGTGSSGQAAASGVYFYELQTEQSTACQKMLLLK